MTAEQSVNILRRIILAAVELDEKLSVRAGQLTEQPNIGRVNWSFIGISS